MILIRKMPRLVAELHAQPVLRSFSEGGGAESEKLEHLSSVAFPTFVALAKKVAKDEAIKAHLKRLGYGG